jgi:hypothetical protein
VHLTGSVTSSSVHGSGCSESIKGGKRLDQLSDNHLLNKDSVPWRCWPL